MADEKEITITPPTGLHQIDVTSVPALCGVTGHYGRLVTCSCGFQQRFDHNTRREEVNNAILYHRVKSIEEVLGMRITIEWQPGS